MFKTLAETEDGQICVLRSLYELWHLHQQVTFAHKDVFSFTRSFPK